MQRVHIAEQPPYVALDIGVRDIVLVNTGRFEYFPERTPGIEPVTMAENSSRHRARASFSFALLSRNHVEREDAGASPIRPESAMREEDGCAARKRFAGQSSIGLNCCEPVSQKEPGRRPAIDHHS